MARIILALCLLISSVVSAQPGYTNINARYKWIAGGFDSSLILPRYGGVPSGLRSAWNTDGQLAVDTANNHLYVYSGGAWVRIANYSDVGSTYTFPYSVVAPGSAIQLENDTTANPANYFYGRNSAGRRGWYPQSGITGVNLFNSDGTLTGYRTVNGNYNGFEMVNISSLSINIDGNEGMTGGIDISGDNADNNYHIRTIGSVGESGIYGYRSENKLYSVTTAGSDSSFVQTDGENGISIKAFDGSLKIPLLNYTLSTTGKKIMLRDTATGDVWNIDPALIGGGGSSPLFPLTGTGTATGNSTGALGSYDLSMTNNRGYLKFQNATNPLVNIQGTGNSPLFQVDSSSAVRFKVYAGGQIAAGDSSANLFIGHNSGLNIVNLAGPPGNWNISLGENVFEDLTIGNDMVGIGPNTFRRSIASFHSIGIGTGVGSNATHLEDVIGIGVDVLIGADTITRSTATGSYSQFKYTKAAGNTSSGFASQYGGAAGPWTGSYNTSDGNQSLNNITTGSYGSAYGDRSQFTLTTGGAGGGENASFGAFSAYTTNHSRGVYLGPFSGYFADEDDVLYVHNSYSGIADEAEGKAESMLYGKFGINGANQLRMNGKMGINTMPDASAALDVTSTTTGLLVPRMTTTQRNAISSPAVGLMIYNTTDSAFNYYRLSGWTAIGGGGGGTPGGSNTQIQFNNAGSFGGSSTFTYDLTTMKFGGNSLWLNSTFQPYHATNDKQLKITNSGTGAEGLFFSVSDVPKAFIESTSGYALKISSNGGGSYFELGTVGGIGVNKAASSLYALGVDGTIADNGNNGNYLIQPALFGNSPTKPSYSFFSDENSGMYWISADKFGFSTNGIKRASFSATKFDINEAANDYDVVIAGTTDANLIVTDASTNRVGIGTGSPDSKLHVVGSIKMVDGNQAADKVMVSDANGVGSWQASRVNAGIYTPTLTNVTNVAASTAYEFKWSRVDSVYTISGEVDIDPTSASTLTQLGISLPPIVTGVISAVNDASGTAADDLGTSARVNGDVGNNRMEIRMTPTDVSNRRFSVIVQLIVFAP